MVVVVAPVLRLPQPNAARDKACLKVRPEPVLANDRVSEDELKERDVFFLLLAGRNRAGQAQAM